MTSDLLQTLLSNLWAIFLVVVFFGGSIFVHELGHFLAARRRGVHVERFSIGFGPPIWSRRGRDGVEYRVSWFPLGGYVLLPQLADLGAIEGESHTDVAKLPPVSYATKMLVFVAGATFNVLFAFALACVVWVIGQPVPAEITSTTVAEVLPELRNARGELVRSPASIAGLRVGDVVIAVDGRPVATFDEIRERLALSSGWSKDGNRETIFRVRRGTETVDLALRPILGGDEKIRQVGFRPASKFIIDQVIPGSPAEAAGFKSRDEIVAVEEQPRTEAADNAGGRKVTFTVERAGGTQKIPMQLRADQRMRSIGIVLQTGAVHPTPFKQIKDSVLMTIRTLSALLNPRSDIGLSHMSGPIGIIKGFVDVSRAGLPFALWFTILVNVNLAIFNLLPIPVLDGGQMLFATIARLRGRPLPVNFIMTAQSVFLVLLFSMVLYVSVFDVRRIVREAKPEPAPAAQKDGKAEERKN